MPEIMDPVSEDMLRSLVGDFSSLGLGKIAVVEWRELDMGDIGPCFVMESVPSMLVEPLGDVRCFADVALIVRELENSRT